jgi:hypothetical protein
MALNIASLVAAAKSVFDGAGLLVSVTHAAYSGENSYGQATFATAVTRKVALQDRVRHLSSNDLGSQMSTCSITILDAVTVDVKDRFTLPDGRTPAIMSIEGVLLSDGRPATMVYF